MVKREGVWCACDKSIPRWREETRCSMCVKCGYPVSTRPTTNWCACELRARAWNPNTKRCETCGLTYKESTMATSPSKVPQELYVLSVIDVARHIMETSSGSSDALTMFTSADGNRYLNAALVEWLEWRLENWKPSQKWWSGYDAAVKALAREALVIARAQAGHPYRSTPTPPESTAARPAPDWHTVAQEIAVTPGGVATMRLLQAHGIWRLSGPGMTWHNELASFLDKITRMLK